MDIPQEELAAEQAALTEKKEEEVRADTITRYGFDEVDDAERIDKIVADKMDDYKKLTTAIGQKVKWRTEATKPKEEPPKPSQEAAKPAAEEIGKVVAQELEKRDLDSLEYSDDLKKEIQRVAQVQGISIKQAARDPYIVFKIDEWKKAETASEAAISRTNRSSGKKSYSIDSPPDVDMTTAEGRQEWADYTEAMKKAGH